MAKTTNRSQVAASKKAAALKAAADEKRAQSPWLRDSRQLPPLSDQQLPPAPERVNAANLSQGPPRLLDKAQVCAITNVSFPTIWSWMQRGRFPRGRVVGGKTMWLSSEVEAWMAALPVRKLKGDGDHHTEAAE